LIYGIKPQDENKLNTMNFKPTQFISNKSAKKITRPFQDYFVINPNNSIYQFCKFIVIVLCIVSSFVYAFYAAFRLDVDGLNQEIDETLDIKIMDIL